MVADSRRLPGKTTFGRSILRPPHPNSPSFANLNNLCRYCPKHASTLRMRAGMNAVVTQIGDLAEAGEKMVERLRRKAFLPDSRKELNIRFGIAERSEEHTSELQSLMRHSHAAFCLKQTTR